MTMRYVILLLVGLIALAGLLLMRSVLPTSAALPSPAPLNTNAASENIYWDLAPEVATDGAGTWVATWHTAMNGLYYKAYLARSTDDGATWADPLLLTAGAPIDSGSWREPYVA